jgi:hypothetical protein
MLMDFLETHQEIQSISTSSPNPILEGTFHLNLRREHAFSPSGVSIRLSGYVQSLSSYERESTLR